MENQFFRCTQRAITQRRVITLGQIFIKMVLNRAQGFKEKSQEVSARKNNNQQRYNKKCRRGGRIPPPGSFRVKLPHAQADQSSFNSNCIRLNHIFNFGILIHLSTYLPVSIMHYLHKLPDW